MNVPRHKAVKSETIEISGALLINLPPHGSHDRRPLSVIESSGKKIIIWSHTDPSCKKVGETSGYQNGVVEYSGLVGCDAVPSGK